MIWKATHAGGNVLSVRWTWFLDLVTEQQPVRQMKMKVDSNTVCLECREQANLGDTLTLVMNFGCSTLLNSLWRIWLRDCGWGYISIFLRLLAPWLNHLLKAKVVLLPRLYLGLCQLLWGSQEIVGKYLIPSRSGWGWQLTTCKRRYVAQSCTITMSTSAITRVPSQIATRCISAAKSEVRMPPKCLIRGLVNTCTAMQNLDNRQTVCL